LIAPQNLHIEGIGESSVWNEEGSQIHRLIWVLRLKLVGYVAFLITSKVLDVRRRNAYGPEGRPQSFDFAQDREPVERQMMP
jgi:hypothetical protein